MSFLKHPLPKFYLSCLLSSWGDRLWYFALSIYFITLNKDSLLITAINGLTCNIVSICVGPLIGSFVDKYQRIKVVRLALFVQNSTVAFNCCLIVLLILFKSLMLNTWNGYFFYFCQAIIITLNVISNLASMASKISIEKDWIIVIAQHEYDKAEELVSSTKTDEEKNAEFKKKLALMNATVRRIDLSTNVVSPLVAGLIMSFLSFSKSIDGTVLSAIFFAVWNIMSLIAEYSLLSSVYNNVPGLEKSKIERNIEKKKSNVFVKMKKSVKNIHKGWLVYFRQGIVLMPSLSLSLLFLTVLSFDGITIGFAKSQKLSEFLISLIQAVGSLSGILGTLAYPLFHNKLKINLQLIGVIGSVFQLIFLFICLVSIWLPGSPFILADKLFSTRIDKCSLNQSLLLNSTSFSVDPSSNLKSKFFESPCLVYTSILVLLGAMALSRFGLWITDLVIHQIIQESVDEKERGVIGGVQSSINRIFDLLKFIFVIIFSDVTQYGYLVIISVVGVIFSFILYTVYAIREVYVKRYSKVPVDEIQPKIRKSMIKFNPRTSNEIEYDSDDSFDNEVRYINEDEKEAAS